MKGESGHSNAFVSKGKLVVYDSLFEHIRERSHMMAIIRHEMGHAIFNHIPKITILRIVYYDLFFIGMAVAVYYKKYWLPMFGINYNSVFLALFVVMQFLHFRIFYYCYNIAEHAIQRKFEFMCDDYSAKHGGDEGAIDIANALSIIFYKNKLDYYTDPLYSVVKNHHPTLQERVDALLTCPMPEKKRPPKVKKAR